MKRVGGREKQTVTANSHQPWVVGQSPVQSTAEGGFSKVMVRAKRIPQRFEREVGCSCFFIICANYAGLISYA
jgi:hypothetical protein